MNRKNRNAMRKLTENEAVFREYNETAGQSLADLKAVADAHNDNNLQDISSISLQYYCECSDEDCKQRIAVPIRDYNRIHENRSQFVITPGHEVLQVERVVTQQADYYVVEKFLDPPENPDGLHETDLENS